MTEFAGQKAKQREDARIVVHQHHSALQKKRKRNSAQRRKEFPHHHEPRIYVSITGITSHRRFVTQTSEACKEYNFVTNWKTTIHRHPGSKPKFTNPLPPA
jgi:hypothetical protein